MSSSVSTDILPADKIKRQVSEQYDADPTDWHVIVGKDRRGHQDLLIIHGSDLWFVKEEQINPFQSVGYGVRTRFGKDEIVRKMSPYTFGLRSLSHGQAVEVLKAMNGMQNMEKIVVEIMKMSPVSSGMITGPMVVQGPVVQSIKPVALISKKQEDLELKLRNELEKLLARKYPQTIVPYV